MPTSTTCHFPDLRYFLLANCVSTVQATSHSIEDGSEKSLEIRQTTHDLFKGKPIPRINWMSSDTYNFTWGLTGVDNYENDRFGRNLVTTLGVLLAVLFAYRLFTSHLHHIRLAASIASTVASNYFAQPLSRGFCFVQKHILLAPLWGRRHNEAFQTTRLYLGTLPSRLNAILLFAYISSNILYCSLYLPWNGNMGPDGKFRAPTKAALIAEFRGRTGVMATVNMVPLFVCMMRNNYLGKMAGVGFNTWNLYHRWAGRIVFLEAFAHVTAWWINQVDQSGENGVSRAFSDSRFLRMGLLAITSLILIVAFSVSPVRHAHYQVFLAAHQILVIAFLVGVWMHCHTDQLPQEVYVNIAIALWGFERLHRLYTIWRKNVKGGQGWSINIAEVRLAPAGEDACRVSITMNKGWTYKPGQYVYLYIPRLSWTQSHPFSIAWSTDDRSKMTPSSPVSTMAVVDDKEASSRATSIPLAERTTIHFIISRRDGFTNRLFQSAASTGESSRSTDPEKEMAVPRRFLAFVEGPYSNETHSFDSFASLLFVAGGSGITHPLGYIRHLLVASTENLVCARIIKLVWVVRDKENVSWVAEWLEELWKLDAGRNILEVEIYVTRPSNQSHLEHAEMSSGGARVRWLAGRPQMKVVIAGMLAVPDRVDGYRGALSVNVCGPGSLADNVRAAVRGRVCDARIEFSEESFTWS